MAKKYKKMTLDQEIKHNKWMLKFAKSVVKQLKIRVKNWESSVRLAKKRLKKNYHDKEIRSPRNRIRTSTKRE